MSDIDQKARLIAVEFLKRAGESVANESHVFLDVEEMVKIFLRERTPDAVNSISRLKAAA